MTPVLATIEGKRNIWVAGSFEYVSNLTPAKREVKKIA